MNTKRWGRSIRVLVSGVVATGLVMAAGAAPGFPTSQQRSASLGPEEGETLTSWTDRWIDGPVRYIASQEEQDFYASLESVPERLQFIRLFWERRDPTPRDMKNEFLAEFERRIAWADENFSDGDEAGWETIFGHVALVAGIPDRTLRTSQGMEAVNSERPLVVWSYDRKIQEWPLLENFIFFYRFRNWRLMPHSESLMRGSAREAEAQWEMSSNLDVLPEDLLRVQQAMIEETTIYPANYRSAIDRVRAAVAFPDVAIPFAWEAHFASGDAADVRRVDLHFSMRMDAFVFHAEEDIYRTRMLASALLSTEDGEPIAETTEPIVLEVPIDELEARGDEIVERTISLQAPPGSYRLQLILEDPALGFRSVYRETLEVPER